MNSTFEKPMSLTRILVRVETELKEKEKQIQELQQKLEKYEYDVSWTRHISEDDNYGLPVPRLEINWIKTSYNWIARYDLIKRDYMGEYIKIPLGRTESCRQRSPICDGNIDLPIRDGIHIKYDAIWLDLPAYVRCGDEIKSIHAQEKGPALWNYIKESRDWSYLFKILKSKNEKYGVNWINEAIEIFEQKNVIHALRFIKLQNVGSLHKELYDFIHNNLLMTCQNEI